MSGKFLEHLELLVGVEEDFRTCLFGEVLELKFQRVNRDVEKWAMCAPAWIPRDQQLDPNLPVITTVRGALI